MGFFISGLFGHVSFFGPNPHGPRRSPMGWVKLTITKDGDGMPSIIGDGDGVGATSEDGNGVGATIRDGDNNNLGW